MPGGALKCLGEYARWFPQVVPLKAFASLAGAVITIDALHTQADTAQAILGRHADYVMTVKGNGCSSFGVS